MTHGRSQSVPCNKPDFCNPRELLILKSLNRKLSVLERFVKTLVTGGAGFIGSHIVRWLCKAGYEVVAADILRTGRRANLPADVPLYEVDIRDRTGLAELFAAERPQAVVHQAALANVRESMEDPITYAEVNIIGTLHLLELAKEYNCSKFIFASTGRRGLWRRSAAERAHG